MTTRILLIAHAPLASALQACVGHVFPERQDSVLALDVLATQTASEVLAQARLLRQTMGPNDVLLLTDVLGATPCNVARALVNETQDLLVTGVNLPMLWRAVAYQHEPLRQVAQRALEGGQHGVAMPD